jgi:hypothetical protein
MQENQDDMEAGGSNLFQMMFSLMYTVLSYMYSELQVFQLYKKTPWLLVRKRTIPTERPPLVGEVSGNFCV